LAYIQQTQDNSASIELAICPKAHRFIAVIVGIERDGNGVHQERALPAALAYHRRLCRRAAPTSAALSHPVDNHL
jgi:hypothetical protein